MEDIQLLKPTVFFSVPRILNRLYDKIHEMISKGGTLNQSAIEKAIEEKIKAYNSSGSITSSLYDMTTLKPIR